MSKRLLPNERYALPGNIVLHHAQVMLDTSEGAADLLKAEYELLKKINHPNVRAGGGEGQRHPTALGVEPRRGGRDGDMFVP